VTLKLYDESYQESYNYVYRQVIQYYENSEGVETTKKVKEDRGGVLDQVLGIFGF